MPLFSSDREKRLWVWTLVVVATIYSTLGLTATLADKLLEQGLFVTAFIIAFFMIWVAILTQGLKVRPGGIEIGIGLGVAAAYLMVFARMGIVERTHLFEYGVVAALIHEALRERLKNGRRVPSPAVLAVLITSLVGWLDEGIQSILPDRVYDIIDVGFNALAALMAVVASVALTWARARWQKR